MGALRKIIDLDEHRGLQERINEKPNAAIQEIEGNFIPNSEFVPIIRDWGNASLVLDSNLIYSSLVHGGPAIEISDDFVAWLLDQSSALRERRVFALDWDNLAEELDEMYAQLQVDLDSDLRVILQHMLKLQYAPSNIEWERRARGWKVSATEHRNRVAFILGKSPTLRAKVGDFVSDAYSGARKEAAIDMDIEESTLPPNCPWDVDQIRDLEFFPQRQQV